MEQIYRFRNQRLHADCTMHTVNTAFYLQPMTIVMNDPEVYLDRAARFQGINRKDINSFTQAQFPVPIPVEELDHEMTCPYCRKALIDEE